MDKNGGKNYHLVNTEHIQWSVVESREKRSVQMVIKSVREVILFIGLCVDLLYACSRGNVDFFSPLNLAYSL